MTDNESWNMAMHMDYRLAKAKAIHQGNCEKMQAEIDRRFRALMRDTRKRLGLVPLGRPKNSGFRHG